VWNYVSQNVRARTRGKWVAALISERIIGASFSDVTNDSNERFAGSRKREGTREERAAIFHGDAAGVVLAEWGEGSPPIDLINRN